MADIEPTAMNPMSPILLLLLWPVRQVKRLLSLQLNLQWQGRRPRLVLEDPSRVPTAAPTAPPSKAGEPRTRAPAAPTTAAPACEMHVELRALMTQHRKARQLMRHLAYIERCLKLKGAEALDPLPLDVLKKASAQLEELVTDWSSPGLAELRLRLTMLVSDKEDAERQFRPSTGTGVLSDFLTSKRVQVDEGSPSDFEALQKIWAEANAPQKTDSTL